MKTIMDFLLQVWQYPYLWYIVVSSALGFYMCFAHYKKTEYTRNIEKNLQYYVHLYVYVLIGLLGGVAASIALSGGEYTLVFIFGLSLGSVIAISENPPIVIMGMCLSFMITCSISANTCIPIISYVCIWCIGLYKSYARNVKNMVIT